MEGLSNSYVPYSQTSVLYNTMAYCIHEVVNNIMQPCSCRVYTLYQIFHYFSLHKDIQVLTRFCCYGNHPVGRRILYNEKVIDYDS